MSYEKALEKLRVMISDKKSLVSKSGSAEFAKRFRIRNLTKDISPVSVRSLLNYFHFCGQQAMRISISFKRFSTFARCGGVGYRTLATLNNPRSLKLRRLKGIWDRYRLPFEWWLGRGRPLDPYIRGLLVELLRRELKPRELQLPPLKYFEMGSTPEAHEWSLYRRWMGQWLKYLQWYCQTAMRPDVTIEELFDAPMVTHNWKITDKDLRLTRLGFQWRAYDIVGRELIKKTVTSLPYKPTDPDYEGPPSSQGQQPLRERQKHKHLD